MLLLLREGMEVLPAYLKPLISSETELFVALEIPDARPYVLHVHDGIAEARCGGQAATRQGLRIVGGRRPWKAMKLQSCFEPA
jgi:hypothetical protein